jgi:hypothetical protein
MVNVRNVFKRPTRSNCNCDGSLTVRGPSPWTDVSAFGAKGDGQTDDTMAIRAAIVAATEVRGTVFFPPSRSSYVCTDVLTLDNIDGLALRGGPATIKFTRGSGQLISAKSSVHLTIDNLAFIYTDPNYQDDLIRTGHAPSNPGDAAYLTIENCEFDGTDRAMDAKSFVNLDYCICSTVRNCNFSRAKVGIWGRDGGYSNVIHIADNTFLGTMAEAAIKNAGEAWLISGNAFEPLRDGRGGGYVQTSVLPSYALTFLGNWFGDAVQPGGTNINIQNGSVLGLAVLNNRFARFGVDNASGEAIRLSSGGQGAIVIGNRFETPVAVAFGPGRFYGMFAAGNDFQVQAFQNDAGNTTNLNASGNNNLEPI